MDLAGHTSVEAKNSLVFLAFLRQSHCENVELQKEFECLDRELTAALDVSCSPPRTEPQEEEEEEDEGSLQSDGHLQTSVRDLLRDVQPRLDQGNALGAAAIADELRAIADQLDDRVVTRATERLSRRLSNSPADRWRQHLTLEVEWLSRQVPGSGLAQERVVAALVLTLVKGVCERTPALLRTLFWTALRYVTGS